ncbi:MAG: tagaturonate reductase [Clostridiales bacterium]|nr:tagaturonate reductase [Clostridiales bacterium]
MKKYPVPHAVLIQYADCSALINVATSKQLEIIISNITEAGIAYKSEEKQSDVPNTTYPAMLTDLLYCRFSAGRRGVLVLPVELIESNADVLKSYILRYADDWRLGDGFKSYINNECKFCCTLVDRIVTGFPSKDYQQISNRLGYENNFITVCEPYNSWIVQGDKNCANIFSLHKAGLNIKWCDDLSPYRERKVRILNGAHTMSVLSAYLRDFDIVRDMVNDPLFCAYIKKGLFEEVIPTLNLSEKELADFAESVLERFSNPFIDHKLLDISLNSVSKFKSRCLPTILDYKKIIGKLPHILCFALASLIFFTTANTAKMIIYFTG